MLVGRAMQVGEGPGIRPEAREYHARTQHDACDRLALRGDLLEFGTGGVDVGIDDETTLRGQREKPQHVAARQRGDEGFLGIDGRRRGPRRAHRVRGGRRGHHRATVEAPFVQPRVAPGGEIGFRVALPMDRGDMLAHRRLPIGVISIAA